MDTLIGKKLGMSRIFKDDGSVVPVTIIQAGPCPVVAVRTRDRHGYDALQIGFDEKPARLINRPEMGHLKKAGLESVRHLGEVRLRAATESKAGDVFKVDIFREGEKVDVIGTSRGMGFAGVVKRHHFAGGPVTHGQSDRLRAPGSVGASSYPSRSYRGTRMGGRMGGDTVTVLGLRVVRVIAEENLILVRGAVPGKPNGLVRIRRSTRK